MSKLSDATQFGPDDERITASRNLHVLYRNGVVPREFALQVSDLLEQSFCSDWERREKAASKQRRAAEVKLTKRDAKLQGIKSLIAKVEAKNPKKSRTWILEFVAAKYATSRRTIERHLDAKIAGH